MRRMERGNFFLKAGSKPNPKADARANAKAGSASQADAFAILRMRPERSMTRERMPLGPTAGFTAA
jgi:hypothetical protein